MKTLSQIWRRIACGGLTLAVAGGIGLPISAGAACDGHCAESTSMSQPRHKVWAMHEKVQQLLARMEAEDAALQKMVAGLNQAPEAKKADLEAAILTKLVAQHHQMLGEWESLHAQMMHHRNDGAWLRNSGRYGVGLMHRRVGQCPAPHGDID